MVTAPTLRNTRSCTRVNRILCRVASGRRSQVLNRLRTSAIICDTDAAAERALGANAVGRIVWEVSRAMPVRVEPVPRWLLEAAESLPLLLYADATPPAMRAVTGLARTASHLQIALIGYDDLDSTLRALANEPAWREADQSLVSRLAREASPLARDTVILAALISKRRSSVEQLAAVCAVAPATLRYRLRTAGAPPVRDVLGLLLCAHTIWRLNVLSWTPKQAAFAAGFASTSAFTNYIRRHAGATPAWLARNAVFDAYLDSVADVMTPRRPAAGAIGQPALAAAHPARGESRYTAMKQTWRYDASTHSG